MTGLDGIKRKLEPPKPVEESLYDFSDEKIAEIGIKTLPYSLREAIEELKNDRVLVEALGEHTFKQYVEAKTAEYDEYRLQVTQWEIERYLEKI